ncbi:MAG: alpha/beta fold hydrolase [Pseudomonadales bacterium]|jgi:non-heme chloroperoxidase
MAYCHLNDGVPLYYRDEGQGRPLVLLQALTFGADYFWQRNIPELAKSYRVIAPDLRGQGLSGKPNHGYSIARLAADIDELLTRLDLNDVVLLGYSLGGFVSLQYLQDYGAERIGGLVLMEMTPRLSSTPGWAHPTFGDFPKEAAEGYGDALRDNRGIYNDFFQAAFLAPPEGAVLEDMIAQTYLTPTEVLAQIIDEMAQQDWRDKLTAIPVPTALFYSYPNNNILPTAVGQWIQQQIPESELVLFGHSSHAPFWEEADKFNSELARLASSL